MTLSTGTRLGPYEVLSPLGSGGMGEVYRARDTRLEREVAIKVLPDRLVQDSAALSRFEREAKAVAALSHPNILAIHDFGTHEGVAFAVMELLEGETLRARLDAGPISQKQAVEYAIQIAGGLAAAHEKGVIHRDLKPENLFVTKDDHLKILDFGLAKRIEKIASGEETSASTVSGHTEPGTVMGTVGYMSPEQVRGLPIDHRSDIFSFGTILYELLSGNKAFRKDTAADTMAAILMREPPELSGSGRSISPALDHIVRHCLEKNPEQRFQSAKDIAYDLHQIEAGAVASGQQYSAPPTAKRKVVIPAAVGVAVILIIAGVFVLRPSRVASIGLPERKQLAVSPFRSLTSDRGETRSMGFGLAEMLSARLTGLPGVQVVAPADVASAVERDSEDIRAARSVGANLAVLGTLKREPDHVGIDYRLVSVHDGTQISVKSFRVSSIDLFSLQDALADSVAKDLQFPGSVRRAAVPPGLDANQQASYLQAIGLLQQSKKREAVEQALQLLRSLEKDRPSSGLVQAALGRASLALFSFTKDPAMAERAIAAAEAARELDPGLTDVDITIGRTLLATDRPKDALKAFRRALVSNPDDIQALLGFGDASESAGDKGGAEAGYRKAADLQPFSIAASSDLGALFFDQGRYSEAVELFRRVTRFAPDSSRAFSNLGGAEVMRCNSMGGLEAFRKALDLDPRNASAWSNLGLTQLWVGRAAEAVKSLEEASRKGADDYMIWGNLGDAYSETPNGVGKAANAYEQSNALARARVHSHPADATAYSFLGANLAKTGHTAEATEEIGKALALDDKDPNVLVYAATVSALAGRDSEALDWLRKAVAAGYCREIITRQPEFARFGRHPDFQSVVTAPTQPSGS